LTARDRIVLVVVLVVAALAGAWFLVLQPKREEAATLDSQVAAQQQQLNSAQAALAQGQQARRTYQQNVAELARLGEAVPADDEIPSLIYELQSAAKGARIDFRGVQVGTGGSSSTSTGGAAAATPSATLPPGVSESATGFPTEQFTFTFHGDFFQLVNFIRRVQQFVRVGPSGVDVSGRLLLLSAIGLSAGPKGFPQIAATFAATTFLMPDGQSGSSAAGASPPSTASASTASTATASNGSSPITASSSPPLGSSGSVPAAAITPGAR
jgi:hypothetical protein